MRSIPHSLDFVAEIAGNDDGKIANFPLVLVASQLEIGSGNLMGRAEEVDMSVLQDLGYYMRDTIFPVPTRSRQSFPHTSQFRPMSIEVVVLTRNCKQMKVNLDLFEEERGKAIVQVAAYQQ
ncbi:hypothetical protein L3X38_042498 [Prunus dulcis]|uniref:Uncharacterized protein n=1 Tax=Prunus dulcis TaxID=3755 RepID=A0AAD4UWE7_PRUDU|nr:hypothetical protein L3X38_042498 [Prunus dulcis]